MKIIKRLERIYDDNFGDYKQISPNLYELRFFFGKGYRIYYTIQNDIVVILLQAGDKSDQQKDLAIAKSYLNNIKGSLKLSIPTDCIFAKDFVAFFEMIAGQKSISS